MIAHIKENRSHLDFHLADLLDFACLVGRVFFDLQDLDDLAEEEFKYRVFDGGMAIINDAALPH